MQEWLKHDKDNSVNAIKKKSMIEKKKKGEGEAEEEQEEEQEQEQEQ